MFNFERLDSWHRAVEFADFVYASTSEFPREEMFGLTMQMRKAAVSISSNIAEGSSRSSRADFARFTEIATGSLFEVVSQSVIARRRGLLAEARYLKTYEKAERLGRMLSGLGSLAAIAGRDPSTTIYQPSTSMISLAF